MTNPKISTEYPFKSNFVEVNGSKIHYIDEGEGDPILFLHGMPTWSYLWRNIIPMLSSKTRCIAPDLMGMGKSDKPDIDYSVFEHIDYINAFIAALDLKNITIVMHGWGSVVGFNYAMQNEANVRGLAFYESHMRAAIDFDMLSLPIQQSVALHEQDPEQTKEMVLNENCLVERLLRKGVIRKMSEAEMDHYRQPFPTPESRQLLWRYITEVPNGDDEPADVVKLINAYSVKLCQSKLPKLMFYAVPGFLTTIDTVSWCRDNFENLTLVDLEDALHFVQESDPQHFGRELATWYDEAVATSCS